MISRAHFYPGSVVVEFRGDRVEVEYLATHGDVDEWWFADKGLNRLELSIDEQEDIAEAVWEDAQL